MPTGDFALLGIAFNDDGKVVILTPPLVNTSGKTHRFFRLRAVEK